MKGHDGYRMEANPLNVGLRDRLAAQRRALSDAPQRFDTGLGRWTQLCVARRVTHAGFLQSPYLLVDVTDRGMVVLPLLWAGRCYLRCAVRVRAADGSLFDSHDLDDLGMSGAAAQRRMIFGIGEQVLAARRGAESLSTTTWLHDELPLIVIEVALPPGARAESVVLAGTPHQQRTSDAGYAVLEPELMPLPDPGLTHNNSGLPDPPPPADLEPCVLVISADGAPLELSHDATRPLPEVIIGDRLFGKDAITVHGAEWPDQDSRLLRVVIGVGADERGASAAIRQWAARSEAERAADRRVWAERVSPVGFEAADEVRRHLPYAVYNSLSARSVTDGARSIFLHGRRDRGYADAACLHQSYQMHLPALAAGWYAPVREELLAFASLQDERGYLSRQPRPGRGWHPYAGQYSNAHFALALHRYVSWSGDTSILDEPVQSVFDGRETLPVAERLALAIDWLLHSMPHGLVPPCGWCDAWPPEVIAQGQVSAATVLALGAAAELAELRDDPANARRYLSARESLAAAIIAVLADKSTGLVAEHLYPDGRRAGDRPDDFWVPTQVWGLLAGVSPDPARLTALIDSSCMDHGLRAITLTSADRPYLAASTDGLGALTLDSTMTWLGATWPELTHLYCLALIGMNGADAALRILRDQQPTTLRERNPAMPVHYYAEKYLYPGDEPWLCTWAGDPTFVEVLLTGFAGVRPSLRSLHIRPSVPTAFTDGLRCSFVWRGHARQLTVEGTGSVIAAISVNGTDCPPDAPLQARQEGDIRVIMRDHSAPSASTP